MALVRWEDRYAVGQPQIDDEHRYLFQLINDFHDAFVDAGNRAQLLWLLNRLVDYAQRHFTNEERLMLESGYPGLDAHRARHVQLFEQIFVLNSKFEERTVNPAREAVLFLRTWLADHILHEDMAVGAHLKCLQSGAEQVAGGLADGDRRTTSR